MGLSRTTKILNMAETLFAARGYERTTVKRIAAEASVPLSFVRKRFASKRSIYEAVIDRALKPPIDTLRRAAEKPESIRPEVVLAGAFEFWSMHPSAATLLYRELLSPGPVSASVAKWNRTIADEIRRYSRGRADEVQAASQLVMAFNSVVGFYALGHSLLRSAGFEPDPQELRRRYRAMLLATSDQFAVGISRDRAEPTRSDREADAKRGTVRPGKPRPRDRTRTQAHLRVVSGEGGS